MPPDLTIVLIARGKAPGPLREAASAAGGEVLPVRGAPGARAAPPAGGGRRQPWFRLEPAAARTLVERMGTGQVRLENQCRPPRSGGPTGGTSQQRSRIDDRRTSETAAGLYRTRCSSATRLRALEIGERLISQGENVTGLIYALASRLRKANLALAQLESGVAPKKVESSLGMHPTR